MTEIDTTFRPVEEEIIPSSEPIRLPEEPARNDESPENVIVINRLTMYYTIFVGILLLGAYVVGWFMGSTSGGTVQAVRTAVQEAVSTSIAGLPANPGSVAVAQPQQPPTEDPNRRFAVSEAGNPVFGPNEAPVTIIEFSDFQCPFCGRFFAQTLQPLLKRYEGKVRLVYRDLPLDQIHPYARSAAEAAQCANDQNKFWEYHDLLFQNQQQLAKDNLLDYARRLNLDLKQFQSCVEDRKYAQEVQSDVQAADELGINGTPTFFINGRKLVGAQPLSAFIVYIDAELAAKRAPAVATPTAFPITPTGTP